MKKRFGAIISVFGVMVSASMAQITNPVPYADTFENDKYAVGSNLVGTVWQGDTNDASAVVTNLSCTSIVGYPVTNATHDQVLAFSAGVPITNEFNAAGLAVVALDTMIKPTFSERPEGSQMAAVSNSQMSLYIDTNGYINVFHGIQNYTLPADPNDGWAWTTLTNTTAIQSGTWARVTVVMNYDSVINGPISMFQVALNGTFITSPDAYLSPDISTGPGGTWFVSPKWTAELFMHKVVLSGSGLLDDMVVTTNTITYTPQEGSGYATNGVSIDWMTNTYKMVTNSDYPTYDKLALGDWDNDGAPTWSEYYAGTDPTNSASKLMIVSLTFSNNYTVLKWIGTTNARAPYAAQLSSNLLSIANWTNAPTSLTPLEGTNEASFLAPLTTPGFMRVIVNTNAP